MRIKMKEADKEYRLERLNRRDWEIMEISGKWLILRKDGITSHFALTKKHENRESKFNYDFVRRLIEDAN